VISVGDAVLKLGVDKGDLDKGLQGIKGTIQQHSKAIGMAMTAAGGAILAAGALSVKTYAAMGDEVAKLSRKTGITTETLSELRHVAEISGTSLEGLEKATKRMSTAIGDAQDGLTETIRDFDKLGISVEELKGLSPEEAFLKLGEAIAGIEDPLVRANVAQGIFGRAGMDLIPMFDQGAEAMAELRQEAHALGIVFDQEAAAKAEEMTDAMTRMNESVSGLKMAIAEHIIPILMPMVDRLKEIILQIKDWMKEHSKLTDIIIKFAGAMAALMVVGGPMLIFAPTIGKIIVAFKALVTFTRLHLIPTIVAAATAFWAKAAAILAAVSAILGPIGLAAALVGLGMVIAGTTILIKNHIKAMSQLTDTTDSQTTANVSLSESNENVTAGYGDMSQAIGDTVGSVRELTDAQREQMNITEKLMNLHKMYTSGLQAGYQAPVGGMVPTTAAIAETGERLISEVGLAGAWAQAGDPWLKAYIEGRTREAEALRGVNIYVELDGRTLAKAVGAPLVEEIRLKTGTRI